MTVSKELISYIQSEDITRQEGRGFSLASPALRLPVADQSKEAEIYRWLDIGLWRIDSTLMT